MFERQRKDAVMCQKETKKGATPNKEFIFQQLVNSVKRVRYPLYSGKRVIELPLYFALGKTFKENYECFSSQYLKLLCDNNVDDNSIEIVKELTNKLLCTVNEYLNGKIISSYSLFADAIKPIKDILPVKPVTKRTFYRMRTDVGITDKTEFYHIPFSKVHLSKSERFSIEGYPCLYLGYSKRVCEIEISSGSLAKFTLKEAIPNILDLTLGQGEGRKDIPEIDLVKIFPLIASCYIVPYYSTIQEKECRPEKSFFREEYIIPQLLTLYLKEEKIADGIIYYSVKDPNLDTQGTGENDLRNLVLFTDRGNQTGEIYDNKLLDRFDITV